MREENLQFHEVDAIFLTYDFIIVNWQFTLNLQIIFALILEFMPDTEIN